jgi:predicted nucleotidyltransferase
VVQAVAGSNPVVHPSQSACKRRWNVPGSATRRMSELVESARRQLRAYRVEAVLNSHLARTQTKACPGIQDWVGGSFYAQPPMSTSLKDRAERVTEALVEEFPTVSGVWLFGSVARGDEDELSDIDLFILGNDPHLRPSIIRSRLHLKNRPPKVSIVYHTPETLERFVKNGSRFIVHLQLEGEVLFDSDGALAKIQRLPTLRTSVKPEVDGQLKRLELLDRPQRFNGNLLFPLTHAFSSGKAIVMAILAENQIYEFNRDGAFDAFVERFPESRSDIETLRRLASFSALVVKGSEEELPFPYRDCEEELTAAVAAVRHLASFSRDV